MARWKAKIKNFSAMYILWQDIHDVSHNHQLLSERRASKKNAAIAPQSASRETGVLHRNRSENYK